MKIYLDIDGVLLTRDHKMPEYAEELISYLTEQHKVYWLTTHCRGGDNGAITYLSDYYPGATLARLEQVIQTDWMDLKTEAIDFSSEFIWLDDCPFESEKRALHKYNRINALIVVDLNRESELRGVKMKIEQLSDNS